MAAKTKEEWEELAKVAEQAERYDDMADCMEKLTLQVTGNNDKLDNAQRNLLSVAFKNVVGSRRSSWRVISSIEQKSAGAGNESQVQLIKEFRGKIEGELNEICSRVLVSVGARSVFCHIVGWVLSGIFSHVS